ncbi:ANTAR domain-containing response regulator [Georhizobium sp. MAB10]|uniref:ANTAR domain-containing response regulator n=1 Tax=Georhizobium sp. MAB10 TaxID=3028319 RepID=UPI003855C2E3
MTAPRFVQNFSQCRAIIVSRDARALDMLERTLMKLGLSVSYAVLEGDKASLGAETLEAGRDILFVDGDLDSPLDIPVTTVGENPIVPVVGLIGVEAPSRLRQLVQMGASAYLRKPVHGATVYSALVLGVNAFNRKQTLEQCLETHETRRRQRRYVIKAVIEIMRSDNVDDDEAYARLRRMSMRNRVSVEDFCEHFVRMRAMVNPRDSSPDRRREIAT